MYFITKSYVKLLKSIYLLEYSLFWPKYLFLIFFLLLRILLNYKKFVFRF